MLDTITTYPETESKELTELKSRLKHVDIYLDVALPRAYKEEARGNLDLDNFITDCGTKGCVAFHMASALGNPLTLHNWSDIIDEMIFDMFGIEYDIACLRARGCFMNSSVSLDERKASMQLYRAELVSQIEALAA